ncbi:carbohydrate kinase [bacterium]|nr:carbohydrate kinase [bacterium]MBU1072736.1 carbohydrate kinase [bacterium]MBU1675478.1 carbohydrate kinase [bacterium]
MQARTDARPPRPVVFGEVLFDHFPDGAAVLGGAPFNVAWHLEGFGLEPLFVSRIGDDERGREIVGAMTDWGLDVSGLQRDPQRPTGEVRVALADGQPTFDILADRAYDAIGPDLAAAAAATLPAGLLYHGTLALRGQTSRAALTRLREVTGAPAFLDVNLRPPWYDRDTVLAALDGARWAKLNEAELRELSGHGGQTGAAACALAARHDLDAVIVTLGADGAIWSDRQEITATAAAVDAPELVDTVGAGDAFASVCIAGLLRGMTAERILHAAHRFAAAICRIRGAVARDPGLYRRVFGDGW